MEKSSEGFVVDGKVNESLRGVVDHLPVLCKLSYDAREAFDQDARRAAKGMNPNASKNFDALLKRLVDTTDCKVRHFGGLEACGAPKGSYAVSAAKKAGTLMGYVTGTAMEFSSEPAPNPFAGLVAVFPDKKTGEANAVVAVAFHGTCSAAGWGSNFATEPISRANWREARRKLCVEDVTPSDFLLGVPDDAFVHCGFLLVYMTAVGDLCRRICEMIPADKLSNVQLVCCGHSQGAAVAQLAAFDLPLRLGLHRAAMGLYLSCPPCVRFGTEKTVHTLRQNHLHVFCGGDYVVSKRSPSNSVQLLARVDDAFAQTSFVDVGRAGIELLKRGSQNVSTSALVALGGAALGAITWAGAKALGSEFEVYGLFCELDDETLHQQALLLSGHDGHKLHRAVSLHFGAQKPGDHAPLFAWELVPSVETLVREKADVLRNQLVEPSKAKVVPVAKRDTNRPDDALLHSMFVTAFLDGDDMLIGYLRQTYAIEASKLCLAPPQFFHPRCIALLPSLVSLGVHVPAQELLAHFVAGRSLRDCKDVLTFFGESVVFDDASLEKCLEFACAANDMAFAEKLSKRGVFLRSEDAIVAALKDCPEGLIATVWKQFVYDKAKSSLNAASFCTRGVAVERCILLHERGVDCIKLEQLQPFAAKDEQRNPEQYSTWQLIGTVISGIAEWARK